MAKKMFFNLLFYYSVEPALSGHPRNSPWKKDLCDIHAIAWRFWIPSHNPLSTVDCLPSIACVLVHPGNIHDNLIVLLASQHRSQGDRGLKADNSF